jgi:16S rRNA (cytidine1402-2'-O)-methyltransferase
MITDDGIEDADAPDAGEGGADLLAQRTAAEIGRLAARPLPAGLYLVATPIGNLGDITLRALTVLARAATIYCEDTRHSRTLVAHFGITTRLKPYHEHNADEMRPRVLAEIADGRAVALISDAGTPLISDPGFKLVRACAVAGYRVESLPGPSSPLAALTSAGLPTDSFLFAGFLPAKSAQRHARILELKVVPATIVLLEAPQRVAESLADLAEVLGPREAAVARELTKLHETIHRGTLPDLAEIGQRGEMRGEIVIVIGPPGADDEASEEDVRAALGKALETMSLRDAAKAVSDALGVPKARVYDLGLDLRRGR